MKAYSYFAKIAVIPIAAVIFDLLIIIALNFIHFDLSGVREWVEVYAPILFLICSILVLTFWQKLMPTLRTLFSLHHRSEEAGFIEVIDANKKMLILLIMPWLLFAFALYSDVAFFSSIYQHTAARYGYIANLLLALGGLVTVAALSAPIKAKIDVSSFASDTATDQIKLTESQEQARQYLAEILSKGMPRSVAITGDWGSGKTAVYRCARRAVERERSDTIWVEFDPWRYASEEALVKGFYESIARSIDESVPGFQNALRNMVQSVDQFVSKNDKTGLLQILSTIAKDSVSRNSSPDILVRGLLAREGKRLVIVMDDIERQYGRARTYRALQLVHHAKTMGDDNVQVVSIFEKDTLLRAAPLHMISPQEYLEKFSEIEINISPSSESSLKGHLNGLLSDPTYAPRLPRDFNLELSPVSIRDLKSHRGVIRAFNELILEFTRTEGRSFRLLSQNEDKDEARIAYVAYEDRFMLGHLKLKYPAIYRDISLNRGRYTQEKEKELSVKRMFMDNDEQKKEHLQYFNRLFAKARLEDDEQETVKELLQDMFPVLEEIFGASKKYIDLGKIRKERRVAHRDVLDAYFALTQSQDAYLEHEKWIEQLLDGIEYASNRSLNERFKDYMQKARSDQSEVDSVTLLRNELLKPKHKAYQLTAFRAWLRVILSIPVSLDDDNYALGRVLSAINDYAQKAQPETRISVGEFVFTNIKDYIADPRGALLTLLFLLPERNNGYLKDYIEAKGFIRNGLYQRVLSWVERYYAKGDINIYRQYSYGDWAFVSYQWALSSRAGGSQINTDVPGAKARFRRANDYLFAALDDTQLVYEVIEQRFWHQPEGANFDDGGWRVNNETVVPFDANRLNERVQDAIQSGDLTSPQRQKLKAFADDLEKYIVSQSADKLSASV
jgi:hypothetical protein